MPHCATLVATLSLVSAAALARTEDRDVPEFDAVEVASGIRVTIEIGPRSPVRVEANDDLLALVDTHVEEGALHVGFKPHTHWRREGRVTVSIKAPQIRAIAASGGSLVRAALTRATQSALEASGGSELHIRGIDAERLAVEGSGGSVLEMEGRAGTLDLQMSGGTRLDASNLSVKDVTLQASGGSTGKLHAQGRIRGSLSGGSELHVRGGATTAVTTTGGSSVETGD